eukprot:gene31276-40646_t
MARFSHQNETLFIIAISFIGDTATTSRCKLFQAITLPSLQLALLHKPQHSKVLVMLVNDSVIVNPTCAAIMSDAKNSFRENLIFSSTRTIYEVDAAVHREYRYFFFSRLDCDDAFSYQALSDLKYSFIQSSLTVAVYSPMYVTLWYPPTNTSYPCGQFIYNRIFRNFHIMQTLAVDKLQLIRVLKKFASVKKPEEEFFITWLRQQSALPFFFIHHHPEQALERVKDFVPICTIPQDCLLFFNTWINGVSGFVHTQIDLSQSSNSSDAPKLQLDHYNWSLAERHRKESIYPKACKIVAQIGTQLKRLPPIKGG